MPSMDAVKHYGIGLLLTLVVFVLPFVVIVAVIRFTETDTGPDTGTEPQHHCRYDPRFGDDC